MLQESSSSDCGPFLLQEGRKKKSILILKSYKNYSTKRSWDFHGDFWSHCTWASKRHSVTLLLQTLSDLGLGSRWLHADPRDKSRAISIVLSATNIVLSTPSCYFLFQREIKSSLQRSNSISGWSWKEACIYSQAAFHSLQASHLLHHGSCPASLDWIHSKWKDQKRQHVCELDIPSSTPIHFGLDYEWHSWKNKKGKKTSHCHAKNKGNSIKGSKIWQYTCLPNVTINLSPIQYSKITPWLFLDT